MRAEQHSQPQKPTRHHSQLAHPDGVGNVALLGPLHRLPGGEPLLERGKGAGAGLVSRVLAQQGPVRRQSSRQWAGVAGRQPRRKRTRGRGTRRVQAQLMQDRGNAGGSPRGPRTSRGYPAQSVAPRSPPPAGPAVAAPRASRVPPRAVQSPGGTPRPWALPTGGTAPCTLVPACGGPETTAAGAAAVGRGGAAAPAE